MIRLVAGALCLATVAGCAAEPAVPTDPTLPPRPREVPVLGLDPCKLMPTPVLTELRLEAQSHPVTPPPDAPPNARVCGWDRSVLDRPSAGLGVGVLARDTSDYLAAPGAVQTVVAGFPAVQLPARFLPPEQTCDVLVDVAPAQTLFIPYGNTLGDEVGATHELMCERAHRAAEGVMRQLLATRK